MAEESVLSPALSGTDADGVTTTKKGRVLAWCLWDTGGAAFNAVITTFVFTVWLGSSAFVENSEQIGEAATKVVTAQHSSWIGLGLTIAGITIALLAPAMGTRSDSAGRRKLWLGVFTGAVIVCAALMFLVQPKPGSLESNVILGVALLSVGTVFFDLAAVNYNAMLTQVAPKKSMGTISGIGWASGYFGGIVLLAILLFAFIQPDVGLFGVTSADGLNIRVAVLFSAVWMLAFTTPILFAVPEKRADAARVKIGFFESYLVLFRDIAKLWREDRSTLLFLIASAIYRDGLAGVFTFGALIAADTFGFSTTEVMYFAIAANAIAGLATLGLGFIDDWIGPKRVVVASLVGMLVFGMCVFLMHDGGQWVFWLFGLGLCVWVGPAQSASRSLLGRVVPEARASEMFGLYATTGRAASFICPALWSLFITLSGNKQYMGILAIMLVLAIGLALLLPVKDRYREAKNAARS